MRAAGAWEVWTALNDAGWYYSDPEGEDDDQLSRGRDSGEELDGKRNHSYVGKREEGAGLQP